MRCDTAWSGMCHDGLQCAQETETRRPQVSAMRKRDLAQNFFPATGETEQNLAAILSAARSFQKAMSFQSVDQLHGTVMLDLQTLGENSDSGRV